MGHLDINGFKMNKTAIISEHGYDKEHLESLIQ